MRWDDFRRSDNVEDATAAAGAAAVTQWPRRPRHWNCHCAWPDRLGARHRSERAHWRCRDRQRRRLVLPAAPPTERPAHQSAEGSVGRFRCCGPWQYRGYVEQSFSGRWPAVSRATLAAVLWFRAGRLRFRASRDGAVYCPTDRRIYLDTSFFNDMRVRFKGCSGKACEFADAYVIAHEVGHHVQNLLGILPKVQAEQRAVGSKAEANRIQVRVELQADCLAGIWAHHSNQRWNSIEPGDVEAALQTASAIGDDRLQQQSRGYVVPDAFTHGSSAQRQRWFTAGLKEGKVSACNTFAASSL